MHISFLFLDWFIVIIWFFFVLFFFKKKVIKPGNESTLWGGSGAPSKIVSCWVWEFSWG